MTSISDNAEIRTGGALDELHAPNMINVPTDDPTLLLFEPALSRSLEYKRAVGYFTSGWIKQNASGLAALASNGGRARWVTSPHLSAEDWAALSSGTENAAELIESAATRTVNELTGMLEADTLNTVAWMVADGVLQFRLAVPRTLQHNQDFHSKFGIFLDQMGPGAAFIGSMNETARGYVNHEVISVFLRSRTDEMRRIYDFDQLFESIWAGEDLYYKTYDLPQAVKDGIVKLVQAERPYQMASARTGKKQLRDYQDVAMRAWMKNNRQGLLEMATGTGKTITAIACIESTLALPVPPKLVLIACPFQHLVDQWAEQLHSLKLPIVTAHGSAAKWLPELQRLKSRLSLGTSNAGIIVTTYSTLCSDRLQEAISDLNDEVIFVADECHYLGAPQSQRGMNAAYPYRLGLSATPTRYYDEAGTERILDYFNDVVYEFGMEQAIADGFLVPYHYFPEFVELTDDETEEYLRLSEQISRLAHHDSERSRDQMKRLAIQRARVVNNAVNKLTWLQGHLESLTDTDREYTLVYSGDKIFKETTTLIGGRLKIRQHEFTSRQSRSTRRELLDRFAIGDLQVLTAMKCLDEGVDVPPTRRAYFLASSGNPREFIQRRGRILRPSPGKLNAQIYDAIAVPPEQYLLATPGNPSWKTARAALRSQLARVEEFSRLATNRIEADAAVFQYRLHLDLPLTEEGEANAYI